MAISVVQAAPIVEQSTGSLPATTTVTVTLAHPTGSGNTLVACITAGGSAGTGSTVSGATLGGAADNWQAAAADTSNVSIFTAAIWYDPGCAAGQTAVVVTLTGGTGTISGDTYVAVYEVAGVLAFDKTSQGDAASGATTFSSGATSATTAAAEIFFGCCTASGRVPVVTGVGTWTTQSTGAGIWGQAAGYQIVSSTGTATFSGTISASSGYAALTATFQLSGLTSGPEYAASYDITAGGSGSWVNPVNATGAPDGSYATWTAP